MVHVSPSDEQKERAGEKLTDLSKHVQRQPQIPDQAILVARLQTRRFLPPLRPFVESRRGRVFEVREERCANTAMRSRSVPDERQATDRMVRDDDVRTWYESHERVLECTQLLNGRIGSVEHDLHSTRSRMVVSSAAGTNLEKRRVPHPSLQHQEFEEHERLEPEAVHQFPQGGA